MPFSINNNNRNTFDEDPWKGVGQSYSEMPLRKFEDDFVKVYEPLTDSDQYIASLEKKLLNIRKVGKNRKLEKVFVQSVESTWSSYMCRLIADGSREHLNLNQDLDLEKSLTPTLINSWLNPEQALTVGELTELLKKDSLSLNIENFKSSCQHLN